MAEYIEREKIKFHRTGFEERCHNDVWTEYVDIAYKSEIDSIPAADVRPVVKARWIKGVGENGVTSACHCSVCGFEDNRFCVFNFCPNCGADMREES